VVDVPDRPHVQVRLTPLEFLLRHVVPRSSASACCTNSVRLNLSQELNLS
jgi:hypothetical protein